MNNSGTQIYTGMLRELDDGYYLPVDGHFMNKMKYDYAVKA